MMDGLKRLQEELGKLTGLFFILVVALDFKNGVHDFRGVDSSL
jgi:hypothetical protein